MLLGSLISVACATGPRPTLVDTPVVEDPAISTVIESLEAAESAEFTAEYRITVNYGGLVTEASVSQEDGRRSVTIGEIRFISDEFGQRTCDIATGACQSGLDDTRISDIQITHQFWSRAMVNRLRTDADRNIAPARASEATQAGEPAVCAVVPVAGGEKSYCALTAGPLSLYAGPDVLVELITWRPTSDPALFGAVGA